MLVTAVMGIACADLLDLPEELPPTAAGAWACLGAPANGQSLAAERTLRVRACNFISNNCAQPVTGLSAKLCSKRDVGCTAPIVSGLVDRQGELTFAVPGAGPLGAGFDGYLEVTSASALCTDTGAFGASSSACTFAPACDVTQPDARCSVHLWAVALLFFNPDVRVVDDAPLVLPLIPSGAGTALLQSTTGLSLGQNDGLTFVTARDCTGGAARGVTFWAETDAGPASALLYLTDGLIGREARKTDASGIGGILSASGALRITGRIGESAASQVFGEAAVMVRPRAVSYVTLTP